MPRPKCVCILAVSLCLVFAGCPPPANNTVTVPSVADLTQAAATTAIQGAQLSLGAVTTEASEDVPEGCVISQSPAAGAKVAPGTAVNLVVSTGWTPSPAVAWQYIHDDDYVKGLSIQQTDDDGFIIGGAWGGYNMYAMKLSAAGSLVWGHKVSHLTPGANPSELWRYPGCGIQQTGDGGYITAGSGHDYQDGMPDRSYVLVKLDRDGVEEWFGVYAPESTAEGGGLCFSSRPGAMQITSDGGCVVFGSSYTGKDLASILKTDGEGVQEFAEVINDNQGAYGQEITAGQQTADEGYAWAGYSEGASHGYMALLIKVDKLGELKWSKTYQYPPQGHGAVAYAMTETADGDYLIGGELINDITKALRHGVWIARVDSVGNELWSRAYGDVSTIEYLNDLEETPQGDFLATGEKDGHLILSKFNAAGDVIWNFEMEDVSGTVGKALALTPDGGCAIVASGLQTVVVKVNHVFAVE